MKRVLEDVGTKDQRKKEAIDSAPEVGGVTDVVGISPGHVPAVKKV